MKKKDLIAVFGTYTQIGSVFASYNGGVPLTRSAIAQWGKDIPKLREYQLREAVPNIDRLIAKAKPSRVQPSR